MALFLGSSLARNGLFTLSEAESSFHPWWETLQDYTVYAMVLIGLFAIPTANNALECSTVYSDDPTPTHTTWINKFCSREYLSLFHSYFPYIVATGPVVLIFLQKFFAKGSSGRKQVKFYTLLVEDSLSTESLSALHRESRRDIKEMRSAFRDSSGFVVSFWLRTALKIVVAAAFLAWLVLGSRDRIWTTEGGRLSRVDYMNCTLDGADLACVIPYTDFYLSILVFVLLVCLCYVSAAFYTLLWLLFPRLRKLGSHLREYRRSVRRFGSVLAQGVDETDDDAVLDVYGGLRSPDVELLLDLLAEAEGVAPAMRILTMLDQEFHLSWRTHKLKQANEVGSTRATVTFSGAPVVRHLRQSVRGRIMYTTSITPRPAEEPPVQNFVEADAEDDDVEAANVKSAAKGTSEGSAFRRKAQVRDGVVEDNGTMEKGKGNRPRRRRFKIRYVGLSPGTQYTVLVSTTLRGQEVAESKAEFTTRPLAPANLAANWRFEAGEDGIAYRADVTWTSGGGGDGVGHVVEVEDGAMTLSEEVPAGRLAWSYVTAAREPVRVRVWSVVGGGDLRSEAPLERTLPPVPQHMRDYARSLERALPRGTVGSKYLFKVALMQHVSKELRELYLSVQDVASMSGRNIGNSNSNNSRRRPRDLEDDSASIRDVYAGADEDFD